MPCLQKYRWVKLARACDIPGKGILGAWAQLAMHAAFRYGVAVSGGQTDVIRPGYWTGKMAELMRILDCRWGSVLPTLEKLNEYGYIDYAWDRNTKRFSYSVKDWVSWERRCKTRPDASVRPIGMAFSVFRARLRIGWLFGRLSLAKRTLGSIYGAIRFGGIPAMCFLCLLRLSSMASMSH